MSAEERVQKLKLELPSAPSPMATYRPSVRVGDILYVSGTGPFRHDGSVIKGKVGVDLGVEQAYEAARLVGLNVLSTLRAALGSLDKVVRIVKVLGFVNATLDFEEQPRVINGFSDLMVEVFGEETGKGGRSAVGMGSLPQNIPVEVEAIFQVTD